MSLLSQQDVFARNPITPSALMQALEAVQEKHPNARLVKMDVTSDLGIVVNDKPIGYIDLMTTEITYFD